MSMNIRQKDPAVKNGQILARDPKSPDAVVHAGQVLNAVDIEAALPGFDAKRMVDDGYALFRDGTRVATIMGMHYGHVSHVVLSGPGLATADGVQIGDPFSAISGVPGLECHGGKTADSLGCFADRPEGMVQYRFRSSDPPPPPPDPYERIEGETGHHASDHAPSRPLRGKRLKRATRDATLAEISIVASYPFQIRSE